MRLFSYPRLLHWSECDPAGIIFFPNYARWMVEGVNLLMLGLGNDPNAVVDGEICGLPSTGFTMRFHAPAKLHDQIVHEISVTKLGTKSAEFHHRFLRADLCLADATETRVWVQGSSDAMRSVAIPPTLRAALESDAPVPIGADGIIRNQ